jgi:hypothetical protein
MVRVSTSMHAKISLFEHIQVLWKKKVNHTARSKLQIFSASNNPIKQSSIPSNQKWDSPTILTRKTVREYFHFHFLFPPNHLTENPNSQLDPSTLALLQEFYTERDEREKQFEDLKSKAEDDFSDASKPLSMDLFTESWQDSQFWYKDETATVLAQQLLDGVTEDSRIAVVSAPSVYIQLRNLLVSFASCGRGGDKERESC